jgi:surface polysaccharide O-acyltransferase-like enzyme
MNEALSRKIKVLGFVSILLVVCSHSNNLKFNKKLVNVYLTSDWAVNRIVENFVTDGIANIAVPFFFVFAGYLLFLGKGDPITFPWFTNKVRKRARTLLLPYLLWSLYGILLYYFLQQVSPLRPFFTGPLVESYRLLQFLDRLLLHPIPYQLWFVRDLMLFVLLSPVIHYVLSKYNALSLFVPLLACWWLLDFDMRTRSLDGLFFFCLGIYLATHPAPRIRLAFNERALLLPWLLLCLLASVFSASPTTSKLLQNIGVIVGVAAVWYNYKFLFGRMEERLLRLSSMTFFIYVSHEPLLTAVREVVHVCFGLNPAGNLLAFALAPAVTIFLTISIGTFFRQRLRPFYVILTGGRVA